MLLDAYQVVGSSGLPKLERSKAKEPSPRKWLGRGAGRSAAKIRGAGGSAGEGVAPHSFPRKGPPRSTPSSTPNFRSTLPSTLPSYFLDFPVSLFCSRLPGSQLLQTPRPATEPRNPETPKVHFESPKHVILDPPKKRPQKSIKMSKSQLKCPKEGLLGHFH